MLEIEIACWVEVRIVEIEVAMWTLRFPLSREFDALGLSMLGVGGSHKGEDKIELWICGWNRLCCDVVRICRQIGFWSQRVERCVEVESWS